MIITEVKIPISLASKKREKQFPYSSCNPPKSLLSRTNSPNSVLSVPSSSKFRSRENAHARSSRNRILLPRLPLPRDGFRRISLSLSFLRRRRRISGRGGFARGGVDRYFFTAGQEESGAEESRLGSQCSLFASSNSVDRSDEPDWPCSNTSRSKPSSSSLTFLPTPSSYSSLLLLCYPETRRDL